MFALRQQEKTLGGGVRPGHQASYLQEMRKVLCMGEEKEKAA